MVVCFIRVFVQVLSVKAEVKANALHAIQTEHGCFYLTTLIQTLGAVLHL